MKFQPTESLVKRMVDTIGLPIYTFRKFVARKNQNAAQVVGIPWYTREDWYKMKALAADKQSFHINYEQWLANTDKSIVLLTNRKKMFERLNIDPIHYAFWCNQKSLRKNRESRTAYTQYLLHKKIKHH